MPPPATPPSAAARRCLRRRRLTTPLGLLAALAAVLAGSPARAGDADAVRDVFDRYKQAVLEAKGSTAAAALSRNTLDYYGRLQNLALYGSSETVHGLPILDRVQVLFYRALVPRQDLVHMSAAELVAYAVEKGWVAKESVEHVDLGEVQVDGDSAWAAHRLGGQPTGARYHFVREKGRWRFDLRPTLEASNSEMHRLAESSGLGEEELVGDLIESASGRRPDAALWEPLFPPEEGG